MELEVLVVEIGVAPVEGLGILGSHLRPNPSFFFVVVVVVVQAYQG